MHWAGVILGGQGSPSASSTRSHRLRPGYHLQVSSFTVACTNGTSGSCCVLAATTHAVALLTAPSCNPLDAHIARKYVSGSSSSTQHVTRGASYSRTVSLPVEAASRRKMYLETGNPLPSACSQVTFNDVEVHISAVTGCMRCGIFSRSHCASAKYCPLFHTAGVSYRCNGGQDPATVGCCCCWLLQIFCSTWKFMSFWRLLNAIAFWAVHTPRVLPEGSMSDTHLACAIADKLSFAPCSEQCQERITYRNKPTYL